MTIYTKMGTIFNREWGAEGKPIRRVFDIIRSHLEIEGLYIL